MPRENTSVNKRGAAVERTKFENAMDVANADIARLQKYLSGIPIVFWWRELGWDRDYRQRKKPFRLMYRRTRDYGDATPLQECDAATRLRMWTALDDWRKRFQDALPETLKPLMIWQPKQTEGETE